MVQSSSCNTLAVISTNKNRSKTKTDPEEMTSFLFAKQVSQNPLYPHLYKL